MDCAPIQMIFAQGQVRNFAFDINNKNEYAPAEKFCRKLESIKVLLFE